MSESASLDSTIRALREEWQKRRSQPYPLHELPSFETKRLTGDALAVWAAYRRGHGVLDFGIVPCPPNPNTGQRRAAILTTFEHLVEESERYAQRSSREQARPYDKYFRTRIDRLEFNGEAISIRDFLGWRYDDTRSCLAMRGSHIDHLNLLFLAPYEEIADNLHDPDLTAKRWPADIDMEPGLGYARAFSDPPYSLRADATDANRLFHAMNQVMFDGLSDDLQIHRWQTNWSNYFEAGREWWGEFLWTVQRPGSGQIVVIAGSATD